MLNSVRCSGFGVFIRSEHWLQALVTATIGCMCLAAGLHGYLAAPARMWERVVLVAAAFLLIKPGWVTDLAGVILLIGVLAAQWPRRSRSIDTASVPAR